MPGPARRQFPSIDPQPRTTTTHNGPGQRNKHSSRRSGKEAGSAAAEAERDKTDQRAEQKHKQAETEKAKDPAQQSTT
jgi:hypothetical protein